MHILAKLHMYQLVHKNNPFLSMSQSQECSSQPITLVCFNSFCNSIHSTLIKIDSNVFVP